ncbi:MAG: electron transport complex subunit RsxC [Caldisericia bacterium]|nr:electron transport complex subunit RsxC [Caldisericia bacterium]
MSKTFFPGGIHLKDNKECTRDLPIELFKDPEVAVILMSQHLGKPAKPIVQAGDKVKIGQLIGEAQGDFSSNIHASISGEVIKVTPASHPVSIEDMAVTIQNDHQSEWYQVLNTKKENVLFSREELLEIIKKNGIVGMGGATFPTHIKLNPKNPVDTLIINGAECEPFLTCDFRLMMEQSDALLNGIKVILKILPVKQVIIGIEENKKEAIKQLKSLIEKTDFSAQVRVETLKEKYPQGAEKNLIFALTKRTVQIGKLPFDIGVVVQNVATVIAIFEAVYFKKPLIDRVLTVTGYGIKEPKNLRVKIGTPVQELITFCQGNTENPGKVIFGGPMMGIAIRSLETPIMKGTSGVLVLNGNIPYQENQCIRCGKCVENCPAGLMPVKITESAKIGEYVQYEKLFVSSCIECGVCSYNCPAAIPLLNYIRLAKAELMKRRNQK